jgi:hypothetical protein
MAEEGPRFGRFTTPEGVTRSFRIANLKSAVERADINTVVEETILSTQQVFADARLAGGNRKMRGGTIDQALADAANGILQATDEKKNAFNQAIEAFIRSTPRLYKDYSGVVAKGALLTTVLNYPTPFANIAAALIKLIPVPSGATWGVYSNAVGTLASALSQVGINISASALTGPVLIGLFALYVQNKRAEVNNIPTWKVFLNDGYAVVQGSVAVASALTGFVQRQIAAFTEEANKQTPSNEAVVDLREIVNTLQMEPTPEVAERTNVGYGPARDEKGNPFFDEEGNQFLQPVTKAPKVKSNAEKQQGPKNPKLQKQLATRKKTLEAYGFSAQEHRKKTAAENLEAAREAREAAPTPSKTGSEGSSAAPSAFMSPPSTASSSSSSSGPMDTSSSGGRRRKTRKPKKIRRITRRFRRHFAY